MGPGRETNQETLNLKKQTEGCCGEGWGGWFMDIGEGMCYGECYELCKTDDSQTSNILYVNFFKKSTLVVSTG